MNIEPIGFVRNEITYPHYHKWGGVISEIIVNEEYANGLIGLEDFSHAIVIFYLHQATYNEEKHLVRHPQEREELPKIGIFAQRARHRPNPIGITTVQILEVEGNTLKVMGLDAINETPVFGNRRILVMDDEKMIRDLAGGILKHLGYEVEFSENGAEAVEVYEEAMKSGDPFDAVVLDLTVRGGMGGREAIRKLLEIDPEVIGIVSSGYSDNAVMTDFKKYGFRGVVAKPYNVREMSEMIAKLNFKPTI